MESLSLHALLSRGVLVARETAHELQAPVERALGAHPSELRVNLAGIQVITPSFFDEFLGMLAPRFDAGGKLRNLIFENSAVDFSRFDRIAKQYELVLQRRNGATWRIYRTRYRRALGPR